MLIGLDAIPLTETKTGVGHYTFELARALAALSPADEFELAYPSRYPPVSLEDENEPPLPTNLRAARVEVGTLGRHWWSIGLPRYIRRRPLALFHGTNYDVPLWRACPTVLTIHDLAYFLHPSTHLARRTRRGRMRLPLMARTANAIITPSESVRREVCQHLRVDSAKVFAVHEAPRRIFRPLAPLEAEGALERLGVRAPFLLAVGTIEPRKNLITLVRAFEELTKNDDGKRPEREGGARLSLVIAGREGWLTDELFTDISRSRVRELIRLTGYVSEADLRALYSACLAFVYPSIYEGFGLPLLEAMACGAPVVASRIPAHAEVAGEESARLFAPQDGEELVRVLKELIADTNARRQLADAGREHAARFTWERTAQQTLDVYGEARRRYSSRKR